MKNSFFILSVLLFLSFSANAYETDYVLSKDRLGLGAQDNVTPKLVVKDPNIGLTATPTYAYRINLKYTRTLLGDLINASPWDYTLTLVLKIKDVNGNLVGTTPSFNLALNFKALSDPTTSIYEDVILYNTQYTWLSNPTAEIYVTGIASTTPTVLPNDILLEVTQIQTVTEPLDITKDPLLNKTSDNKYITWDYVTGAQWYELEWVYIDFYDGTTSFTNTSDAFLYKEPVRITTPAQVFSFHNTYSKGTIYFRIRGATSSQLRTNWYYSSASTIVNANDFEPLKNWQASTTFIENGKYKKSIAFSDGSSRERQAQTLMNSDNTVMLSETKYDFEGKAVINVMPFPYAATGMNYVPNANTFAVTAGADQKTAYDNQTASLALSTTTGSSQYYSSLNPFTASVARNYTPDAQGYPYAQVIHTPDNTGRVSKSSQVGSAFKIFKAAPGSEQDQHFQQNFYATPSSTELYRMFGSNIGQASHYTKTYSIDANGVVSISYQDAEGKVIATALNEKPTNNLIPVVDPYNQTSLLSGGLSRHRLSNQNDVDVTAHISTSVDKIVNLSAAGQSYTFKYDLNSTLDNQLGLCLSCDYTIEIKITDPDGVSVIKDAQNNIIPYYTQDLSPTVGSGCSTATYPTISLSYTFTQIGEYTVTKKLYYKTSSIQTLSSTIAGSAAVSVMLDNIPYSNQTTFVNAFVSQKLLEANCGLFTCESNCDNYSKTFATKLNPATGALYTTAEMATIKSQCLTKCSTEITNTVSSAGTDQCSGYKQQMLSQLSPGGYYYQVPNFISNIVSTHTIAFTPAPASLSDVSDPTKFVSSWADGLLPYHPEYNIYLCTCANTNANLTSAMATRSLYELNQFGSGDPTSGVTGWSDAATKGFLKPISMTTLPASFTVPGVAVAGTFTFSSIPATKLDPFFTTPSTAPQSSTTLQSKLLNYYDENASGHIDYNASGTKTWLSAWEFASYYNRNTDATWNSTIPADYDVNRWSIFKGIYLAEKDKYIQSLILAGCNGATYQDPTLEQTVIRVQQTNFDQNQAIQNSWTSLASSSTQASNVCSDDVCISRAESMLRQLQSSCSTLANITVSDKAEVIYNLYKYFQSGCSTNNPQKLILSLDLTSDPHLLRVKTILNGPYGCTLTPIVTTRTDYSDCKTISTPLNKLLPSPTLLIYIDLINDYLNVNRNSIAANPVTTPGIVFNPNILTFTPLCQLPSASYNSSWFSTTMNSTFGGYPVTGVSITQNPTTKAIQMYFIGSNNTTVYAAQTGLLENIQSLNLSLSSVKMIANIKVDDGPLNQTTDPNPIKYQIITTDNKTYNLTQGQLVNPNYGVSWLAFLSTYEIGNNTHNYPAPMYVSDGSATKNYCPAIANTDPFFVDFVPATERQKCIDEQTIIATAEAINMWNDAVNSQMQTGLNTHYAGCFSTPFTENFYYETIEPKQLYYTLYYYDQAGNLIQTVPPEGVRLLGSTAFDAKGVYLGTIQPAHGLITHYKYNSSNQQVYKMTPDESGPGHNIPCYTFYNDKGLLVLSQNTRQNPTNTFSAVSYDKLGRISKTGDIVNATLLSDLQDRTKYDQNVITYWNVDLLTTANAPADIVANTYDTPTGTDFSYTSRGRVTKVSRAVDLSGMFDSYITYQYDIHGKVKTLVNALQATITLPAPGIFFTVDYTYDLISGNVKQVILDNGVASQFIHKYCYDADNRLKSVKTSRNGLIWEEDARYLYYLHGTLLRTELGEDRVQGSDYLYTLQGWIKGMNMPGNQAYQTSSFDNTTIYNRTGVTDVGGDGVTAPNAYIAQDEYMMNLGYYNGDYAPIGLNNGSTPIGNTTSPCTDNLWTLFNAATVPLKGLYSGNIAFWISDRSRVDATEGRFRDNAYVYKYDQLNRLHNAYYNQAPVYGSNYSWYTRTAGSVMQNDFSASYDLNGNIQTMRRSDRLNQLIDTLAYNYTYQGSGATLMLQDNKLTSIGDLSSSALASYDIDGQSANNYTYDNMGNLIGDVSEQIAAITWNREGKVTSLTRTSGSTKPDFIFKYDVNGKRICKQVNNKTAAGALDNANMTYVYYAYDGSGNLLATYDRVAISSPVDIRQVDVSIYGSSRLGMCVPATPIARNAYLAGLLRTSALNATVFQRQPGYKQYELTDHLGNVRTVITGVKVGVNISSGTTADFYFNDIVSENDYYPFGMQINGGYHRTSTVSYRFGYNGKPADNDWNGNGAMYDYGFRIYDPRICKFLSVDPLAPSYPELTPYQFASNTPINSIDLDGLESKVTVIDSKSGTTMMAEFDPNYENFPYHSGDMFFANRGLGYNYNSILKNAYGENLPFLSRSELTIFVWLDGSYTTTIKYYDSPINRKLALAEQIFYASKGTSVFKTGGLGANIKGGFNKYSMGLRFEFYGTAEDNIGFTIEGDYSIAASITNKYGWRKKSWASSLTDFKPTFDANAYVFLSTQLRKPGFSIDNSTYIEGSMSSGLFKAEANTNGTYRFGITTSKPGIKVGGVNKTAIRFSSPTWNWH